MSVVSYAKEKEVASIPVGDHPQRMRVGRIRCDYLGPLVDCVAPRLSRLKVVRTRRGRRLRAKLSEPARLRISLARKRGRRWAKVRVLKPRARAGPNRLRLGKLKRAGRYRLVVGARDAAGNSSRQRVVRFRVRTVTK